MSQIKQGEYDAAAQKAAIRRDWLRCAEWTAAEAVKLEARAAESRRSFALSPSLRGTRDALSLVLEAKAQRYRAESRNAMQHAEGIA